MLIGAHESIAGGISKAFGRAEEHRAKSFQVFTKSARGWKAPPLEREEKLAFHKEARRSGLPAIAHGSHAGSLRAAVMLSIASPVAGVFRSMVTISPAVAGRSFGLFSRHFITIFASAGGTSGLRAAIGSGG